MQGELTVADAASSRYRGRISTEIVRTVQHSLFYRIVYRYYRIIRYSLYLVAVWDLKNHLIRIGFGENDIELFQKILVLL